MQSSKLNKIFLVVKHYKGLWQIGEPRESPNFPRKFFQLTCTPKPSYRWQTRAMLPCA